MVVIEVDSHFQLQRISFEDGFVERKREVVNLNFILLLLLEIDSGVQDFKKVEKDFEEKVN